MSIDNDRIYGPELEGGGRSGRRALSLFGGGQSWRLANHGNARVPWVCESGSGPDNLRSTPYIPSTIGSMQSVRGKGKYSDFLVLSTLYSVRTLVYYV